MYKWQKFSCIETPVWMSRLYDSGVQYRYTSAVTTAYLTAEQGKPPINGNGQFVWTGASRAQCSSSNYWAKYWASNNNSLRNGVAVGGVSDYYAIVTGFNQWILGATLTHSIYEPYIDHYDYSQGNYIEDVLASSSTAYPENGRHSDGYWYVYVGYEPDLYVKDGGEYIRVSRVYKKVNGVYSEQVNIPSLFPEGVKLRKGVTLVNLLPPPSQWSLSAVSVSNEVMTFTADVTAMAQVPMPTPIPNHIYYGRVMEQRPSAAISIADGRFEYFYVDGATGQMTFSQMGNTPADGQWHIKSERLSLASLASSSGWVFRNFTVNATAACYRKEPMLIDLTACYGAGNEPSKAWCDENIPYFTGMTGG